MKRSSSTATRTDPRNTFDAEIILKKLRIFCSNFFFETDPDKKNRYQTVLSDYLKSRIVDLCDRINSVFDREESLLQITSPAYVFGDLHGNVFDIFYYEQRIWMSGQTKKRSKFVFLGDFVDRGKHSVEVVVYLFCLKMLDPKKFILIRGNHEIRSCNKEYTFQTECHKKFGVKQGTIIFEMINESFSRLPLALLIDRTIFCCHGGVPSSYASLEKIKHIPKPLVSPRSDSRTAYELLWNDPVESMTTFSALREQKLEEQATEFIFNRARNTGKYYTKKAVDKFLKKNKLTYLIRAHECEKKGYRFHAKGKVITIFSSSHYDGMFNTTACVEVTKCDIRIIILKDPHRRRDRRIYSEETMHLN